MHPARAAAALGLCACLHSGPPTGAPPAPTPPPEPPPSGRTVTSPPLFPGARPGGGDPLAPGQAPPRLSGTGLYADTAQKRLADGVRPFRPTYELWSDGAEKTRYVYLPPGQPIDSSNMDRWRFPIGTRLWKEFRKDGKRLETRLLAKFQEGSSSTEGWIMQAYLWDEDERDAVAVTEAQSNVRGTGHEVPRQYDCGQCHRYIERPLGFSAIQLSGGPADGTVRLTDVLDRLTVRPPQAVLDQGGYQPPGDAAARAALGYLHGNCGSCHAPDTSVFEQVSLSLRLLTGQLGAVAETPAYQSTVNKLTESRKQMMQGRPRVVPGSPEQSMVYLRMGLRDGGATAPEALQMPPMGSLLVDPAGREKVAAWIRGLPVGP